MLAFVAGLGVVLGAALPASANGTGVYVNGVELTLEQVSILYQSTGQIPAPGHYLFQDGCVAHVESGQVVCAVPPGAPELGGADDDGDGIGGGYAEDGGEGDPWFSRGSDYSGGYSVGGDGSGCIYTPDWSNC
jgi:hypothetical protein